MGVIARTVTFQESHVAIPSEFDAQRQYWSDEIEKKGGEHAYAEFKEYYDTRTLESHPAAHMMGGLLYKKFGLKGLSICDASFSYGCFHEFIAQALIAEGRDAMREVSRICVSYPDATRSPCIHGAGHGILEYFGTTRMSSALDMCTELFDATSSRACANGVFMEYNTPLIVKDVIPKIHARPFNATSPYAPCDSDAVPSRYQYACYFSLPVFWGHYVSGIEQIGALCAHVPSTYQSACYSGIGINVPGSVLYDEKRILDTCERLGESTKTNWCLSQAATVQESFGRDPCLIYQKLGISMKNKCP